MTDGLDRLDIFESAFSARSMDPLNRLNRQSSREQTLYTAQVANYVIWTSRIKKKVCPTPPRYS